MKAVTYRGKKFVYAKTQRYGILAKTKYWVAPTHDIKKVKYKGKEYFDYRVIVKFRVIIPVIIFLLMFYSIAFLAYSLAKIFTCLLGGKIKPILNKDFYVDENPIWGLIVDAWEGLTTRYEYEEAYRIYVEKELTSAELIRLIKFEPKEDFDYKVIETFRIAET